MRSSLLALSLLFATASIAPADVLYSFDSPADQVHHVPAVSLSFTVPTLLTVTTTIDTGIDSPGVWGYPIESVTISPGLNNTNPFVTVQSYALTVTAYYEDNTLNNLFGTPVDPQIFDAFGQYVDASGDVLTITDLSPAATDLSAAASAAPEPSFFAAFAVFAGFGLLRVLRRRVNS
jgi:hypothetical protein